VSEDSHLERLAEIRSCLLGLDQPAREVVGNVSVIETDAGEVFCFELASSEEVRLFHVYLRQRAKVTYHEHGDCWKLIVVTHGKLGVKWENSLGEWRSKSVERGESFYALPFQAHEVFALENSLALVLLLPETPGKGVSGYAA